MLPRYGSIPRYAIPQYVNILSAESPNSKGLNVVGPYIVGPLDVAPYVVELYTEGPRGKGRELSIRPCVQLAHCMVFANLLLYGNLPCTSLAISAVQTTVYLI